MYNEQAMHLALGQRDWNRASQLLGAQPEPSQELASAIVDDIIRTGVLILERADPATSRTQEWFQSELTDYVEAFGDQEMRQRLSQHINDCREINRGFAAILKTLSECEITQLTSSKISGRQQSRWHLSESIF
jgi:hypothetical protein